MKRSRLLIAFASLASMVVVAQSYSLVRQYDEENGVPSHHITQMLQDGYGFMWFSTWNGLCRFDGYDFQTIKPVAGDGCRMANDRIRSIALRPDGMMICQVEEDEYYLFDTRSYRFSDVAPDSMQQVAADMQRYRQSKAVKDESAQQTAFTLTDRQGNQWQLCNSSISLYRPKEQHTQRLHIEPAAEVKCLFKDSRGRIWLTTRDDAAVRIYDADMQLTGYLGRDGRIQKGYTSFGAAIYCMYETGDGTLWLGSKPHGLFRLKPIANSLSGFDITQPEEMTGQDIYNIKEDRQGRLWIATMRHGLFYTIDHEADGPRFLTPKHYPQDCGQRVRYLHITPDGLLLAAATDGLMVAKLERNADDMHFLCHQRESDRAESLSSSATMDIAVGTNGRLLISTESGGVNIVNGSDLLKPRPVFRHLNAANHRLPSDIALSLAPLDERRIMVTSSRLVTILDTTDHTRVLDARYFADNYRFADARPLAIAEGRWLFALMDGAFTTSYEEMFRQSYSPKVVLTGIEKRGERKVESGERCAESLDTLTLQPHERNVTIHFAALDFSAPERISYAFRLSSDEASDSTQWNYIGHDRSVTLLDLEPGTYRLEICSTNADGEWLNMGARTSSSANLGGDLQPTANVRGDLQSPTRALTIIVFPTFWEAWYGQLLILLLIAVAVSAIVYTILYIRRIKRKQRETLEAYLALIEVKVSAPTSAVSEVPVVSAVSAVPAVSAVSEVSADPTLHRIMKFVEENISNADIGVGDMASAAAVSRSGLQRKLKQAMGITPLDLLREARIKHACQLLRQTDKTVSEVAFASGFTDPKYFSRCFKQSTGVSPTDYKNA